MLREGAERGCCGCCASERARVRNFAAFHAVLCLTVLVEAEAEAEAGESDAEAAARGGATKSTASSAGTASSAMAREVVGAGATTQARFGTCGIVVFTGCWELEKDWRCRWE